MTGPREKKYHQIADALRAQIQAGELAEGVRLPAETTIADDWGTSVPTVRQAMSVLRSEGMVESRHGVGTFVRRSASPAPPSGLGDDLRAFARQVPTTFRAHAERLAVEADEMAEELERARMNSTHCAGAPASTRAPSEDEHGHSDR